MLDRSVTPFLDGASAPVVDVVALEAEIRSFLIDVRALVADHWSGCVPERQAAIASAPYVDTQVFTEDLHPPHPPLGPRDPDWLAPLLSLYSAQMALPSPASSRSCSYTEAERGKDGLGGEQSSPSAEDVELLEAFKLVLAAICDLEGNEPGSLTDTRAALDLLGRRATTQSVLPTPECSSCVAGECRAVAAEEHLRTITEHYPANFEAPEVVAARRFLARTEARENFDALAAAEEERRRAEAAEKCIAGLVAALERIADAGSGIPDWRAMADCAREALKPS